MSIDVGGGPSHNRLDIELLKEVAHSWLAFLKELEKPGEHGTNNNQLKELCNRWAQAGERLQRAVNELPFQGRHVLLRADDLAKARQFMGKRP